MNKFKDILAYAANKIESWWSFWVFAAAILILLAISAWESIKKPKKEGDDDGYLPPV